MKKYLKEIMTAPQSTSKSLSQNDNSYVDDYQPPVTPAPVGQTSTTAPMTSTVPITSPAPVTPQVPVTPPLSVAPSVPVTPPVTSAPTSAPTLGKEKEVESIQDQSIFYLLGVDDGSDEEKEVFLDELQQVIWEDFIESDARKLISDEEMTKLRQMMAKGDSQDIQEEMAVYLEKLIPDLEEIMLEKALELKEDMVWERIAGMREYYLGKPESLAKIDEAEQLAKKDQWHKAAQILNTIAGR